jgi:rhamnosyltransferase
MRVLAHIHTFNDADIVEDSLTALQKQTRKPDEMLLVDNASTDDTLAQPSVRHATVIKNASNEGTSGAVATGFQYALDHGYDWIWIFDADSVPAAEALQKLLELFESFPSDVQDNTAFLACIGCNVRDGHMIHGQLFSRTGLEMVRPQPYQHYYPCHVTIWSGCLYRVAAIREIGLPNKDYVLDWGEGEYGYRVMKGGYTGYVHQEATFMHNVRGSPSFVAYKRKFGPITLKLYEFPPIRCYYAFRNFLYFALFDMKEWRYRLFFENAMSLGKIIVNFMLRPWSHGAQVRALVRGLWDGIRGDIVARY